ncbi:hypothetical protein EX895_004801 [Sporisorium graminicola]|uniref:Uncharacterized protein n=1 Tax=Sporisorium graminicola TaxID=280036 RepID=A0A4U7KPT4_9BASI|nr:hypothetical protein EX895_004801 [Sporisorium graminicola]TKY85976.1 hypothetical protein EX895_004801 [Sporisorium graminicola]
MAIASVALASEDPLNTVAVVPFDLDSSTTSRGASAYSSTLTASANSLAAAASNLITAIAQGSTAFGVSDVDHEDARSDTGSDQGSSSFTYTAPASASSNAAQQGWYASTPYHISNRYYDADITLKATKGALVGSNGNQERDTDAALSQSYPAYLVVVDRSRSLEHHRLLAANLESKVAPGFDADISIVAGVSFISSTHPQLVTVLDDERPITSTSRHQMASQAATPAKISDLVALYADHGWEFIAIDELDVDDSDAALSLDDGREGSYSEADDDDDKDGIERIREALMNHMWNGLVRKDQFASSAHRSEPHNDSASSRTSSVPFSSFSDAVNQGPDDSDAVADDARGAQLSNPDADFDGSGGLPRLDLDNHAEASDLDEQLAKLFLSNANGSTDLAELEAFLESQDPSWPGPPTRSAALSGTDTADATQTFEDDFDDFLPFQSAPASSASQPETQQADASDTAFDTEDLPSMQDISHMQSRLFGSNAAARLEAGPLGMGNQTNNAGEGDLASQLQQLQWHAQRVRDIQDPDQRRKEAALVALAFSMQWSSDSEDPLRSDAGGMTF